MCIQKATVVSSDTLRNYESYLRPFVSWLMKRSQHSPTIVTSQLVKTYMDQEYRLCEKDSYDRYQRQIIDFVNQFLDAKIHAVKAFGLN